jgi:hypothetical protein
LNKLDLEFCDGQKITGSWFLEGEVMIWLVDGKEYRIDSYDDLSVEILKFIRILNKNIYRKSLLLNSCLTCKNFLMSGMARDMGRGQRGVCSYHNNRGVEICYLCTDYSKRV